MKLTLFAVPKPFAGHIDVIQRNALMSWARLEPRPEVILMGDDEGVEQVANELSFVHLGGLPTSDFGTPLVNEIFTMAAGRAVGDVLMYVNADIMFLSDLWTGLRQAGKGRFFLVGRRWDVDIRDRLDFDDPAWEQDLRERVRATGRLHEVTGIDYFGFPRGTALAIPPFALGRTAWDNHLIFLARQSGLRVIDASSAITAVHQNHDYAHVVGGEQAAFKGEEAQRNLELAGGYSRCFDIDDATWLMTHRGVRPAIGPNDLKRRFSRARVLHPGLARVARPVVRSARRLINRDQDREEEERA